MITVEETGRDFRRAGSTTFTRKDLAKGFELDSSFYFPHAKAVRGKKIIDLAIDLPPELVIEVDITRSPLKRFPIFATVGVSEVWRYDGESVRFYALEGNVYRSIEESLVLPPMTVARLGSSSIGKPKTRARSGCALFGNGFEVGRERP